MNYLAKRLMVAKLHQDAIWDSGVNELDVAAVEGKRVKLVDGRKLTEFVSCSYLGLDQRQDIRDAAHSAIDLFGVQMSAARTRIRAALFGQLDDLLMSILGGWYPVTFNSVSSAHLAIVPLLASGELPGYPIAQNGPGFIMDKCTHASLQALRAIMAQFGPVERVDFQNFDNTMAACERIAASGKTIIALCDSVGSMGGTVDILAVSALTDRLGGFSYFDDAHGTSVFGQRGQGFVFHTGQTRLSEKIIVVGSLSKAFGATGGVVALSDAGAAKYLKRYSVPYAFGGPPSIPAVGSAVASANLHLDGTVHALQSELRKNTSLFDSLFSADIVNSGSQSPIRGIVVGEEFRAIDAARVLQRHGFVTTAAMYPTVELGKAMIRLAISATHTSDDIRGVARAIKSAIQGRPG
jgi:7-keto-8-aminopelargonate synthetase-like enzyme